MATTTPSFTAITPYLHYDDVAFMIEWLARVFGFTEKGRWLSDAGAITNAELCAGTMEIWLDGDPGRWSRQQRRPDTWIGVWVDDVDAMCARVEAAGLSPGLPENKFYAVRVLQIRDPEGYTWGFMQRAPLIARPPN